MSSVMLFECYLRLRQREAKSRSGVRKKNFEDVNTQCCMVSSVKCNFCFSALLVSPSLCSFLMTQGVFNRLEFKAVRMHKMMEQDGAEYQNINGS